MRKHIKNNLFKYILLMLLLCCFTMEGRETLHVDAVEIPTDVKKPSKGCVLVGVSGTYVSDMEGVIRLINKYRKEACEKGFINPNTGRPLTSSDYKPIKWSYDLEYIARIRAVEIGMNGSHTRAKGTTCFTLKSPNGISATSECLATSWSSAGLDRANVVTRAIGLWYDEKSMWVDGKKEGTGHYEAMIDPSNCYVGVGSFIYGSKSEGWSNFTCAEFSRESNLKSEEIPFTGACIQTIEVDKSMLSGAVITGKTNLNVGKQTTWKVYFKTKAKLLGRIKKVLPKGTVKWSSTNTSVAKVDSTGNVMAVGVGKATIKAVTQGGYTARRVVTVSPHSINNLHIRLDTSYAFYTGSGQKPQVLVIKADGSFLSPKYYKVTYLGGFKKVGIYKVKLILRRGYKGSKTLTYQIRPTATQIISVTPNNGALTVNWKKITKEVSGFQIQYARNDSFTEGKKTINRKGNKSNKETIAWLQANQTYYVRVRTYKVVNGKRLVSQWSSSVVSKTL